MAIRLLTYPVVRLTKLNAKSLLLRLKEKSSDVSSFEYIIVIPEPRRKSIKKYRRIARKQKKRKTERRIPRKEMNLCCELIYKQGSGLRTSKEEKV